MNKKKEQRKFVRITFEPTDSGLHTIFFFPSITPSSTGNIFLIKKHISGDRPLPDWCQDSPHSLTHSLSGNKQNYSTLCLSLPLQSRHKEDMTCPISSTQVLTCSSLADFRASSNKCQYVVCTDRHRERAQHSLG